MPTHPPSSAPSLAPPTIPPKDGLLNLSRTLSEGGLDLLQPLSVETLIEATPEGSRAQLGCLEFPLGLVVGNTKNLWPAFRSHLAGLGVRNTAELGPDPLDIYVEELVLSALGDLQTLHGVRSQVFFAHEMTPPGPIPIQRICDHSGLAPLGPAHLNIHRTFGPWFALRAVVTLDLPLEYGIAFGWGAQGERPCDGCPAPCRKALSGALLGRDENLGDIPAPPQGLSEKKARWLAVRSVCPVGREHRYGDDQIRYHYDKDRSALMR